MKVLSRKTFKWEEVNRTTLDGGMNYITANGDILFDLNILAVKNGIKGKYVVCNNCSKLIRNTEEAKEKHFRTSEHKANCSKCSRLCFEHSNKSTKSVTLKEDGKYRKVIIEEGTLMCSTRYISIDVAKGKAEGASTSYGNLSCKFFQCRRLGMREIEPLLVEKCPGFFDTLPTERSLIENGWKLDNNSRCRSYKLNNLEAVCDEYGIVNRFYYKFRTTMHEFVYSPKYGFAIDCYSRRAILMERLVPDMCDATNNKLKKNLDKLFN